MKEIRYMAAKSEFFELSGYGYNIMTRKANQFGKFQLDLELTDPEEIQKAEELEMKFGLKIKDQLTYSKDGAKVTKPGVSAITLTAKMVEGGQYPRKFIPTTKADNGSVIEDLISHGAKVTARFKVFPYSSGTTDSGHSYPAGFSFQLENVKVHEYVPYRSVA